MPLLGKTALRGERKQWHHAVLAAGCTSDTSLANERMHDMAGLELKDVILSSRKTTGSFAYSSIGNPMKTTYDFSNVYLSLLERERN
jgi:hypothetical protein